MLVEDFSVSTTSKLIVVFIYLPLLLSFHYFKDISRVLAYITLAVQMCLFMVEVRKTLHVKRQIVLPLSLLVILFMYSIISAFGSWDPLYVFRLSCMVLVPAILLSIMLGGDKSPYGTLLLLSRVQVFWGFVLSLVGVALFFFGDLRLLEGQAVLMLQLGPIRLYQRVMGRPPLFRIASLTSNPNTLGMILMFSQLFTVYLRMEMNWSNRKFAILYSFQIAALFLTQSRSAVLGAALSLFFFYLLQSKRAVGKISILLASVICGFFFYWAVYIEPLPMFSRFTGGITGRDLAWAVLRDRIHDHPFLGTGFGLSSQLLSSVDIAAHNVYLNVWAELGVFGLAVFLALWGLGILAAYKNREGSLASRRSHSLVCAILLTLLFHQMFESKIMVYDHFMYLWVYLIGYSFMGLRDVAKEQSLSPRR